MPWALDSEQAQKSQHFSFWTCHLLPLQVIYPFLLERQRFCELKLFKSGNSMCGLGRQCWTELKITIVPDGEYILLGSLRKILMRSSNEAFVKDELD